MDKGGILTIGSFLLFSTIMSILFKIVTKIETVDNNILYWSVVISIIMIVFGIEEKVEK